MPESRGGSTDASSLDGPGPFGLSEQAMTVRKAARADHKTRGGHERLGTTIGVKFDVEQSLGVRLMSGRIMAGIDITVPSRGSRVWSIRKVGGVSSVFESVAGVEAPRVFHREAFRGFDHGPGVGRDR